jgi:metal-dependent amidase/aminoacylase/carboxypeptidase family protein
MQPGRYAPEVQAMLATRLREISEGICHTHGADCTFEYAHEFAPTVNSPEYVDLAVAAARSIAGVEKVDASVQPMMISEDFGAFLQAVPGSFIFIGNARLFATSRLPRQWRGHCHEPTGSPPPCLGARQSSRGLGDEDTQD